MQQNTFKRTWTAFFAALLMLAFMTPVVPGFSNAVPTEISCPAPSPTVTSQSTSSVAFAWSVVDGASGYKVWYTRNGGDASGEVSVSGTSVSFNGLQSGTYHFYFVTICGTGQSEFIVEEIIILI